MVDSPTTRNRLRKQGLGTNVNSWGDTKLNEAFDVVDQAMDGYLAIALTGDLTLTTTNYSTADQAKRRVLKFTGTLSASANVILPSVEHEYAIVNAAGADVVVKTFAGTGVTIPTGYQARVFCDAVNVVNGSPTLLPGAVTVAGQIHAVTAGTASTDAVNKDQMETAIAAASPTPGTVRVSLNDTTAGYLGQKVTGTGAVTISTASPGGDEDLNIAVGAFAVADGGTKTTSFAAAVNTRYNVTFSASGTITGPAAATAGDVIVLALSSGSYAHTFNPNGLKTNGNTASVVLPSQQTFTLTYTGATDGWV